MRPGSRLWIETTDPLAAIDVPAFCAEEGHRLLESLAVEGGGNRFLIERRAAHSRSSSSASDLS